MTDMTPLMRQRIEHLITTGQYTEARRLLRLMPNNPQAQNWLIELQRISPEPLIMQATPRLNQFVFYVVVGFALFLILAALAVVLAVR